MNLEYNFQQFLRNNKLKSFEFVNFEFQLYSVEAALRQRVSPKDVIGRIDTIFYYKRKKFIGEIKWQNAKNGDFWDACKVLAYVEHFKWQTEDDSVHPAVLIPASSIRLEHQMIAGKLGITIFAIEPQGQGFTMKPLNDEPYWKQLKTNENQ